MRDRIEFDMLLNEVLQEVANPEPEVGLQQSVMRKIEGAQMAGVSVMTVAVPVERLLGDAMLFEAGPQELGVFASLWRGVLFYSPSRRLLRARRALGFSVFLPAPR